MLIGHIGVGLSLKKIQPNINLGVLILLSLGIDLLIGVLLLLEIKVVHLHSSLLPVDVTPYLHVYSDAQPFVLLMLTIALVGLMFKPIRENKVMAIALLGLGALAFHLSFNWLIHESGAFNRPHDVKMAFNVILLVAGTLAYWSVPLVRRTQKHILLFIGFVCSVALINHYFGTFVPTHPDLALEFILQSVLISSVIIWFDSRQTLAVASEQRY